MDMIHQNPPICHYSNTLYSIQYIYNISFFFKHYLYIYTFLNVSFSSHSNSQEATYHFNSPPPKKKLNVFQQPKICPHFSSKKRPFVSFALGGESILQIPGHQAILLTVSLKPAPGFTPSSRCTQERLLCRIPYLRPPPIPTLGSGHGMMVRAARRVPTVY